jgi:hypothetical protein
MPVIGTIVAIFGAHVDLRVLLGTAVIAIDGAFFKS